MVVESYAFYQDIFHSEDAADSSPEELGRGRGGGGADFMLVAVIIPRDIKVLSPPFVKKT